MGVKMHFNCRNLNGTVLLQSLTTSCWLYTWEQTNSSNKFAAHLNMKDISFFTHPVQCVSIEFNDLQKKGLVQIGIICRYY